MADSESGRRGALELGLHDLPIDESGRQRRPLSIGHRPGGPPRRPGLTDLSPNVRMGQNVLASGLNGLLDRGCTAKAGMGAASGAMVNGPEDRLG